MVLESELAKGLVNLVPVEFGEGNSLTAYASDEPMSVGIRDSHFWNKNTTSQSQVFGCTKWPTFNLRKVDC